jgi:Probable lipoprotein LpqN
MIDNTRRWRVLATGVAAGVAGVLGFAGAAASAEPVFPQPPLPSPATVQTVTVTPNAAATAPQTIGQPGVTSATGATPAAGTTPVGIATAAVPAPPQVTITPASSGTLADFFGEKGVMLEPQASRDFKALNIVLPMPQGWAHVPDPNVPDAFAVIADRVGGNGLYSSNAQVVVYRLVGDFDPKEAISHGFIDSQQLPAWRSTDASLADYGGMPSSRIEGTYRENSMTLNTSRRHVIVTSGPDRYLVSLSVTTSVDQAVAAGGATDAIINGFKVSTPGLPQSPSDSPSQSPSPLGAQGAHLGQPG